HTSEKAKPPSLLTSEKAKPPSLLTSENAKPPSLLSSKIPVLVSPSSDENRFHKQQPLKAPSVPVSIRKPLGDIQNSSNREQTSQSTYVKQHSVKIVHSKLSLQSKVPVLCGASKLKEQCSPVSDGVHNQTTVVKRPINAIQVFPNKSSLHVKESIPMNYNYKILSVDPMNVYKSESVDQTEMFQAILRLDIRNKEDALEWLQNYQSSSFTDWRVRRTHHDNTNKLIFKKQYRCHNNTLAQYRPETKEPHYKHTECKASVTLTVKNFEMKRSKDTLLKTHPLEVQIDHCHNHPLNAADSLRHRRPTPQVKEKFLEMFKNGHSPASALRTFQYDLQVEQGDDFWKVLADGALCPNEQWCYYQYYKQFGEAYGAPDGTLMVASLQKAIEQYNLNAGSCCAAMKQIGDDVVVALCTPLMKRVHKHLKSSAEMTFLDSGGMMDRQNTRIFTFLSSSVAGALPTGLIMTSSESEKVTTEGMALLKSILPPNAFFGRGDLGPQIGMTDDSAAERNSLKTTFPGIVLLLCLFHILNAYWGYVLDSKHKVAAEHRLEIFCLFKQWCRCDSLEEFEKLYADQLVHPFISSNPQLLKHLEDLYARAPEWALCYRRDLLTRGNNTDNLSEITIRNYKDVLDRLKAYSLVQLFDFFTTRIESYWERRIAAVVNNRKQNYYKSKYFIRPEKLEPLQCSESQFKSIYLVKNSKSGGEYVVDMEVEICTCPVGKNGAPCKHQAAVVKEFGLSSMQFMPLNDEEAKLILHKIMTDLPAPPGWYVSLKRGPAVSTSIVKEVYSGSASLDTLDDHDHDLTNTAVHYVFDEDARVHAINSWQTINSCIMEGLQEKPEVFVNAVEKMSQHFARLKIMSENAVLGAMHNFGKYNYMSSKSVRKGRYVNVNTISVARRKSKQGGRRCAQQGRPPKSTFTAEHGYNVVKGRKRAHALPHDLTYRVQMTSTKRRKLC
ncbi:Uracil phosphoribosyltransferase, partial [Frankliniella fusca]